MTMEKCESNSLQAEAKARRARGASSVKRYTKGPPKVIAVTVSGTHRAGTRRRVTCSHVVVGRTSAQEIALRALVFALGAATVQP